MTSPLPPRPHPLVLAVLLLVMAASAHAARGVSPAKKRVVILVGLPGSGKTTLAKGLTRVMRASRHTCGDVVRGYIRQRGLKYTPANDRMASQHFARTPGEIARQLSQKIARTPGALHIVDGVRSPKDLAVLEKNFDVRVVALRLPARLRHARMLARGRFAREDAGYFKARDRREIGLGVLHVLRRPFVRLDMSGPLSAVPSQARGLADLLKNTW